MMKRHLSQQLQSVGAAFLILALASACTNTVDLSALSRNRADGGSTDEDEDPSEVDFVIANVNITAPSSGNGAPNAQLFFDRSRSTKALGDVCSVGATVANLSMPCKCEYTWSESNDSSSTTYSRKKSTDVSQVQASTIHCPTPDKWSTEIPDGTTVRIKVVPATGNSSSFAMADYRYRKSANASSSAFADINGAMFDNILRYSCFETRTRGMSIRSRRQHIPDPNGLTAGYMAFWASRYCVTRADGSTTGDSSTCDSVSAKVSAQAYYYNLYLPDSRRGEISPSNSGYTCAKVSEPLSSPRGDSVTPDYWPLDSNYALSITRTSEFRVGVQARSVLGTGDTSSVSTACSDGTEPQGGGNPSPQTSGIVNKCLGYAKRPNTGGTCSPIQLADGTIRPTYRLRRFVALYPPFFDTDGKLLPEPQRTDVIYVLDRPVNAAGIDPRTPYTMRGPKPCPFAYFDHMGVTSSVSDADYIDATNPSDRRRRPGYVATNNPAWNGLNVDGVQFPNIDVRATTGIVNSCAAVLPKLNWDSLRFSLVTPHATQNPIFPEVHVRPGQAWTPHYEEDTAFEACAPQSSPFVDPPLHFARDVSSGNIGWCAEVYPSQNPDIHAVDRGKNNSSTTMPGLVLNYTSHVAKNSASTACVHTQIDMSRVTSNSNNVYPADPGSDAINTCAVTTASETDLIPGVAWHPEGMSVDSYTLATGTTSCTNGGDPNYSAGRCLYCANQTCDRTVHNIVPHIANELSRYPLLARATQVEQAISSDSTYSCMISYDGGGGKTGKATPTGGCCGATVRMDTGSVITTTERRFNSAAHLEPDVPCQMPSY